MGACGNVHSQQMLTSVENYQSMLFFFWNLLHMLDPVKEVRETVNSCFLLYLFQQDELCKSVHPILWVVISECTNSIIVDGDCVLWTVLVIVQTN